MSYEVQGLDGRVIARPADTQALLDLLAIYRRDGWDAYRVVPATVVEDGSWSGRHLTPSPVPPGTRIELTYMGPDPDPLPVGARGTVVDGNNLQLYVAWDSGRSLSLALDIDRYRTLAEEN